ncbi:MAG: nucleotidyltransferase domain-containing protein [Candidatus Omnitrophota bacterium]
MFKAGYKIKKYISEYKEMLQTLGINIEKVILYGSFVRGKERKDSDIDVAVISNDFKKMNLRERLEVLGIAAARIMKPIEAKGYTSKEFNVKNKLDFLSEIKRTGKVIYL